MWKRIVLGAAVIVTGLAVWVFWPESAANEVEGIAPPPGAYQVTIHRDTYGVPHVFGVTDADTAYGLAWAHSEDDFLTIQQTVLAAKGRLGAVYGMDSAPVDYVLALLNVREDVDKGWETLAPDTRSLLDAYADGLNHYASEHPEDVLSGVFPVAGKDVIAGFMQKAPLFYGIDSMLTRLFAEASPQPGDLVETRSPVGRYGSNTFAVSPLRSDAGQTMLAVNSHQPWFGPVAWYEAHLHSEEGLDVVGGIFPGMPVIAHGHNRDLGWSFTVNSPDLIDVYWLETNPDNPDQYMLDGEWRDFEIEMVPLTVRLAGRLRITVEREVVRSVHGPVIRNENGSVYAIRYAAMGLPGMVEQFYRMNKAASFEEWHEALASQIGMPSFNIGYADRTGTIAYVYHGLFPDRPQGPDWSGLLDGTDSSLIWDSYLPLEELPWVIDPAGGYFQNSNSTPFTATSGEDAPYAIDFPESMGVEDTESNRSVRLIEQFQADPAVSLDEFIDIKWDVTYSEAGGVPPFVRRLIDLVEPGNSDEQAAVDVLETWQPSGEQDNRGTALVVRTVNLVVDANHDVNPSELVSLAEATDTEIRDAFTQAVGEIVDAYGRVDPPWSEVNRLVRGDLDIPIGGGPDLLHAVYGSWEEGRYTGVAGDTYLMIVQWTDDGVESWAVHQFGTATLDETSAHYADQAEMFADRRLRPVWFDEEDILANLERSYRPGE